VAELYITGPNAKSFFTQLEGQRDQVHRELGYELDWDPLPEGQDCRIAIRLSEADFEDDSDWPRQHQWLAQRLNELHKVFAARLRSLSAGGGDGDE
jgi:hypothetical protein